jgi:2-polyprenyl-3-methyl-5-hydroxy-6-metoxy-1,4-benzoquinol methylase
VDPLINKKECQSCKSPLIKYYALRSIFYRCNKCLTIYRSNEKKFNLFNSFKQTRLRFFSNSYKNKKNQFLYLINFISNFNKKDLVKSKKVKFVELLLNNYNKNNVKVLDISGAPGKDAQSLKNNKKIKEIAITEYSKEIVKKINERIQIKSFFLDYDHIKKNNINKKYDIIIIWYSIYYCCNLEELILLIKKIILKNGIVIIASNTPNFACLTKFSIMQNYSPKYLWHYKLLITTFGKHNFKIIKKKINKGSNFISHYFLKKFFKRKSYNLISIFSSIFYIIRNIKNITSYKKDIKLNDYICVFKKN